MRLRHGGLPDDAGDRRETATPGVAEGLPGSAVPGLAQSVQGRHRRCQLGGSGRSSGPVLPGLAGSVTQNSVRVSSQIPATTGSQGPAEPSCLTRVAIWRRHPGKAGPVVQDCSIVDSPRPQTGHTARYREAGAPYTGFRPPLADGSPPAAPPLQSAPGTAPVTGPVINVRRAIRRQASVASMTIDNVVVPDTATSAAASEVASALLLRCPVQLSEGQVPSFARHRRACQASLWSTAPGATTARVRRAYPSVPVGAGLSLRAGSAGRPAVP